MLVSEIKEKLENGELEILNTITIKPYLSHVEKKLLCENIIRASLDKNEENLTVCDYFNKKLTQDIGIIVNYTNIELSDEFLEDYDVLCEQGIVEYILNNMNKSDKDFIEDMVSKSIGQEIKIGNSIESIIAKNLQTLISKIPDEKSIKKILKDVPKIMNKINPENMEILKGIMNKQVV